MTVRVGTKFHSVLADSNAKWEVIGSRGGGAWDCVVTEDNVDYVGTRKVFGTEEIAAAVAFDKALRRYVKTSDSWWDQRTVGETLHYHNGFGEYVRGIVVNRDGQKKLMPTALVGKWSSRDLPCRRDDGTVTYGYHVKKIRFPDGDSSWQPSTSCIWEHPDFSPPAAVHRGDPTTMPEIDLSDPPAFEGPAADKAKHLQLSRVITETLSAGRDDPYAALIAVKEMLAAL